VPGSTGRQVMNNRLDRTSRGIVDPGTRPG
jgi:hypothetical protein